MVERTGHVTWRQNKKKVRSEWNETPEELDKKYL